MKPIYCFNKKCECNSNLKCAMLHSIEMLGCKRHQTVCQACKETTEPNLLPCVTDAENYNPEVCERILINWLT